VQIARRHVLHRFALVFSEGHRVGISQCFHILFVEPWPNKSPEPTTIDAFRDSARVAGCWMSIVRGGSAPNVRPTTL
jgi:hypothetical protein